MAVTIAIAGGISAIRRAGAALRRDAARDRRAAIGAIGAEAAAPLTHEARSAAGAIAAAGARMREARCECEHERHQHNEPASPYHCQIPLVILWIALISRQPRPVPQGWRGEISCYLAPWATTVGGHGDDGDGTRSRHQRWRPRRCIAPLPPRTHTHGEIGGAAFRRGPDRAVDERCLADQMAPRAHQLVLRAISADALRVVLPPLRSRLWLSLQFLLRRCRRASSAARSRAVVAARHRRDRALPRACRCGDGG